MASVNDTIMAAAKEMEKIPEIRPPEWAHIVKTGVTRQRPPAQENWWWIRSASMLRKLYLGQPVGVSRFRKIYGGRKNKGHKPEHKGLASGSVTRKVLQQLEQAGLVETLKGKGRKITPKGQRLLNNASKTASSQQPKE